MAEVLGVFHLLEQDAGALRCWREVLDERRDRLSRMLSPSMTTNLSPSTKFSRQAERLGDAAGLGLVRVAEVLQAELAAVAEQRRNSPALLPPVTTMMSLMPGR